MTDTNRVRLSGVRETTLGTTPASPRMRGFRMQGESLAYQPQMEESEEIRDDRQTVDPFKVGEKNDGGINFELIYPMPSTLLSTVLESAFQSSFVQTPERDNDGTADSVITDIGTTANTLTCTTGAAFVVGHLVRLTGNAQAANNGLFPVTTGGATSFVSTASGFVAEAVPPAASRAKVVGCQGVSGDITATATGLASTTLNFTTLGLAVGQWIKVGGTGAAFQFATAARNDWARITAISATALTLDNMPSAAVDAGAGKTIRIFFGDRLRNGTTEIGISLERSFLGQAAPTHIIQRGMTVDSLSLPFEKKKKIGGSLSFMGMGGGQGTVANGSTYDAAPDPAIFQVLAGSANVGRLAENGVQITTSNWASSITLNIRNNMRMIEAVDAIAAVDLGSGSLDVTADLEVYFGDNVIFTKVMGGTPTNLSWRVFKNSQALVWGLPRVTPMSGNPNAGSRNSDVMLKAMMKASRDTLTGVMITLDRLEYFE
ncbi:phage tail tube protein [Sediminicoccus sp. KRV36]|uniref:phage tail tube protein n=1 Tax=Sediminicoccus sp. KRV36 TaxID=3133721 RepID=UPI00200DB748|nr:phage tail tube protein [Sediminicoccus rosea]UPY35497.1 hypothetical protein LHU95_14860 [Sediminicoccus rosea]